MLKRFAALASALILAACATMGGEALVGDWEGEVLSPLGNVNLIFHFRTMDDELECSIDSKFQGGVTFPCGDVTFNGDQLRVDVPIIRGQYMGTLEGNKIAGQWSQAGLKFDFDLKRVR